MRRKAKADVKPIRQRTQFTCVATSTCMALQALGVKCDEETVNEIIGAQALRGSRWEEVLACCQYFGCRATLTTPATLTQVKEWTDSGRPVLIAWNPEGRDWSHASLIYDVTGEKGNYEVHVADPNIPNPDKTVRVVGEDDFYSKWFEKWPNFLVRRPALMIDREVTPDGRQIMANLRTPFPQAVEEIVSNIRHLGYLIVENQWSTTDENPTYKISVPGISDYTLEFQRSPMPSVRLIEGRRVVRTIEEISRFPEIIRHLPKQTSRMASVLPCIQSQTTVTDEEAELALESLPESMSRREKAIMLANLLDDHEPHGRFSMVDLALRDLDNMSRMAGKKKKKRKKNPSNKMPKFRDPNTSGMFDGGVGSSGKGVHQNRERDVAKGSSRKIKHKKMNQEKQASIKKTIPLQLIKKMETQTRSSFPSHVVSETPKTLPDSPVQFRFEVESEIPFTSTQERKMETILKFFVSTVQRYNSMQSKSLSEGTYTIEVDSLKKESEYGYYYLFFNISLSPYPASIYNTKQMIELERR